MMPKNAKATLLVVIFAVSTFSTFSPAFADTFYGPSFALSPASVASGGTVTAQLSSGSGSTFTAPPAGSSLCNPTDPSTCFFPLQACDGGLNYYQINEAAVTDPSGNSYLLGSAVTSGLADNYIASPRYTSAGFAPAINVSATDSGSIPFGTGVGGFFALTSNLPNPPNSVNPEGPYYWWTVAGNVHGSNLRLDQNPSIMPTSASGTYTYDLEGLVFCGTALLFFDARMQFTVSPSQVVLDIVKTGASSPTGCSSHTGAMGSVQNGGTIAYSVTVSNTGSADATSVVVSDPEPSGEAFGAASATSGTITQSGGAGSWSWTGTIAAGGSVTITWTATVSTTATSVVNIATITSPTSSASVTINDNPASCTTLVPHLTTSLSSSSIVVGGVATDTATLSGVTATAGGSIVFNVYSGSTSSSCVAGNLISSSGAFAVSGPGAYGPFTLSGLAAGSYEVQATYSGDAANAGPIMDPCGSEPLTVGPSGCNISSTIASNFNGGQIVSGNYIWFNAHIDLVSPTPSNGLTIHFTGQHITFTANGIPYNLAVPDGSIVFSSAVTSASTTFTASGTWVTTVPVTQTGDIFISGLMFVPATTLPGGINPVTWSGTFSSSSSSPLDLKWQWGAAVYTQPSGQPSFTGVPLSDVAAYNSLNVKPIHSGLFTTPLFPTPHSNGDQSGTPENPAWQKGVTGGARGGGGSNFTGSWSATGEAKCP